MYDHGAKSNQIAPPSRPRAAGHAVQFYESEAFLARTVGAYLGEGLRRGEGLVVIAIREHWAAFRRWLTDEGAPLDDATRSGRVIVLDAAHTLRSILVGGEPDKGTFHSVLSAAFNMVAARAPHAPVRAYGGMVDLLSNENRLSQARPLEQLWNDLLARQPASLLCAYRMNASQGPWHARDLDSICAAHAHVALGGVVRKRSAGEQ